MTIAQFENGYWYTTQLREFAETIGVPSAIKLRKDELEKAIQFFLQTGKVTSPTQRSLSKSGVKDVERQLSLDLPVVNYTDNRETKDFIDREAQKIVPGLKRRSGARYRLNRWREEQLIQGIRITYRDLVNQYVRLNHARESFGNIPHARYINFISDFHAAEKNATREQAISLWKKLKKMDIPKNYGSWAASRKVKRNG